MTDSTSSPSFAQLLRRSRRAAGLTQEELAERAGLSARAVSDLERGENRTPRRDTLELLADALHLSTEERGALTGTIQRTRAQGAPSASGLRPTPEGAPSRLDTLPAQPTPFIGRDRDIEAVRARLLDLDTRLLTLTGPGGTGKTRLALQAAAAASDAFADGAFFVPLAPLSDPALVLPTIAQVLGIGESPGQTIGDILAVALHGKRLLLILDNFEQVLPAATPVLALLANVPTLTTLATSREPLHVRGERLYPVRPLTVPLPPLPSLEAVSQYEAVRLFIARAQDVLPDFVITNETAPAVAEICARLDGLPLAIELVARHSRALSPEALLARLSSRLKMTTGGTRDVDLRQKTLRDTIDWSYSLLDRSEQILFTQLGIFIGGCSIDAVASICHVDGDLASDPLDRLESLFDKSLLRVEEGVRGEPRFMMLETIAEYARERLNANKEEKNQLEELYASYYLTFAENAAAHLMGPEQSEWLGRLEEEHDNLRAVLRSAYDQRKIDVGLRLAGVLWRFWYMRSHWSEGRGYLEELLSIDEDTLSATHARALSGAGTLAWAQGDYTMAQVFYERCLAQQRSLRDTDGIVRALGNLGNLACDQEDYDRAELFYEEALRLSQQLNEPWLEATGGGNLGLVMHARGDYARARDLQERALTIHRSISNVYGVAHSCKNLANVAIEEADPKLARTYLQESLSLWQEIGTTREVADCFESMARVLMLEGRPTRAAYALGAAEALRLASGTPIPPRQRAAYDRTVTLTRASGDASIISASWMDGAEHRWEEVAVALVTGDDGAGVGLLTDR